MVIRTTGLTKVSAEKLLSTRWRSAPLSPFISLALGEAWSFTFSGFAWFSLVADVVGAFASYLAWMWLLGRYPATRVSVFVFLTPAFALVFWRRGGANPLPLRWWPHWLLWPLALCWSIASGNATDRLQRCAIPSLPQKFSTNHANPNSPRRAQSLGTENAFVVLAEVNKLIAEGYDITSFCIGQPDFPAPTHVQEAGHEAIRLGKARLRRAQASRAAQRGEPLTWATCAGWRFRPTTSSLVRVQTLHQRTPSVDDRLRRG